MYALPVKRMLELFELEGGRIMSFPYANSVPGFLSVIKQLRSIFPKTVTADTLKKWGQAPNNETYIIATLTFLGILNDDGSKNDEAASVFAIHDDDEFKKGLAELVKKAYSDLFDTFGEGAWTLERTKLIGFFRQADKSSDTLGKRQASTFQAASGLCGYGELPLEKRSVSHRGPAKSREIKSLSKSVSIPKKEEAATILPGIAQEKKPALSRSEANLTVRIEINLPVSDDQSVYDKIFKSIRENLLDI